MKTIFKIKLLLPVLFLSFAAEAKLALVLVPGYGSSAIRSPEFKKSEVYFSKDILKVFKDKKINTFVATGFSAFGSIQENALILISFLDGLEKSGFDEFILLGHSSGGLYSLAATSQSQHKINHIITVATPFRGVDFVTKLNKRKMDFIYRVLGMRTAGELSPENVSQFLSQQNLPAHLKLWLTTGTQPNCSLLKQSDSRCQAWPFAIASKSYDQDNDGLISWSSAYALDLDLGVQTNRLFQLNALLDHGEEILDYRYISALSPFHVSKIRAEQRRFYTEIAKLIEREML